MLELRPWLSPAAGGCRCSGRERGAWGRMPRGVHGTSAAYVGIGVQGTAPGNSAVGVRGEGGVYGVNGTGTSAGVLGSGPSAGVEGDCTGAGNGVAGGADLLRVMMLAFRPF